MAGPGDNTHKNAVAAMLKLLKDENPEMRLHAAGTLAILGGEDALRALAGVLKNEEQAAIRNEAADALVKLGGSDVTGALHRAVLEDGDAGVRGHIIGLLAQMEGKGVNNALIGALEHDNSGENRRAAAMALAEFDGNEVVHALLKAQRDVDGLVRKFSRESIRKIGGKAIPGLMEAVERGTNAFHKGEFTEGEVIAAAQMLGEIADSSALPKLELAARRGNEGVRDAASDAISAIEARAEPAESPKKRERMRG